MKQKPYNKLSQEEKEKIRYKRSRDIEEYLRYNYYFCANENGTDSYEVRFEEYNKETGYWENKKALVFDFDGKDKHDLAIITVQTRVESTVEIKNCIYQ